MSRPTGQRVLDVLEDMFCTWQVVLDPETYKFVTGEDCDAPFFQLTPNFVLEHASILTSPLYEWTIQDPKEDDMKFVHEDKELIYRFVMHQGIVMLMIYESLRKRNADKRARLGDPEDPQGSFYVKTSENEQ